MQVLNLLLMITEAVVLIMHITNPNGTKKEDEITTKCCFSFWWNRYNMDDHLGAGGAAEEIRI